MGQEGLELHALSISVLTGDANFHEVLEIFFRTKEEDSGAKDEGVFGCQWLEAVPIKMGLTSLVFDHTDKEWGP